MKAPTLLILILTLLIFDSCKNQPENKITKEKAAPVELGSEQNKTSASIEFPIIETNLTPSERKELSEQLSIPREQIVAALELSDLLRITGVGPVYAKILKEMGINNAMEFLEIDSQDAVEQYKKINEEKNYSKVNLSIKDVEYVKRFCEKLDADIQW